MAVCLPALDPCASPLFSQNGNGSITNEEMSGALSALITRADELFTFVNGLKQRVDETSKVAKSSQDRWKKTRAAEEKAEAEIAAEEAERNKEKRNAAWAAKEAKLDAIREKKAAEAAEKAAFEEKVKLKRQQSMAAF